MIELVRALRGRYPIFGICLGHQMIALAAGAKTYKLKFGHRGGNHPVRNLRTGRIEITSQNHSYAVDAQSVAGTDSRSRQPAGRHRRGPRLSRRPAVQRAVPSRERARPQDSAYLFNQFVAAMMKAKTHA